MRNRWAHHEPFNLNDTHRALDSMERLLGAISTPTADEVGRHKREVMRLISEGDDSERAERQKKEEERQRQEEEPRRALEEERLRLERERQSIDEEKRRIAEAELTRQEEEKKRRAAERNRLTSQASEADASAVQITEPALLIRINKNYREGMSAESLYDATRGVWKLGPRRKCARYAMAIYRGIVQEVYTVEGWYPAGTGPYATADVQNMRVPGRWEFVGRVAADVVRDKYRERSVAHYFKRGMQSPVIYVNCPTIPPTDADYVEEREASKRKEEVWGAEELGHEEEGEWKAAGLKRTFPARAIGDLGQEAYVGPLAERYGVRASQTEEKNRRSHIPLWDNLEEAVKVYNLILTSGEVLRNTHLGGRHARPAQLALRLYEEGLVAQVEIGDDPKYNSGADRLYTRLAEPHTAEEVRSYIRGMAKRK